MKTIDLYIKESVEYQLYCDMDGVLCDWEKQLESLGHGNFEEIQRNGGDSLLWKLIYKAGYPFWANMPWTVDGKDLWNFIKSKNPTILSGPPRSGRETAEKGKTAWIKRELGPKVPYIYKFGKQKYELSYPGIILIDDRPENISPWVRAGGIGILHVSSKDTISKLRLLKI